MNQLLEARELALKNATALKMVKAYRALCPELQLKRTQSCCTNTRILLSDQINEEPEQLLYIYLLLLPNE